jgi:hypothetical protein
MAITVDDKITSDGGGHSPGLESTEGDYNEAQLEPPKDPHQW